MLGRRQIREKIIQTLYSYKLNPIDSSILEKNMLLDLEKVGQLYLYQLNFLVALKNLGEVQIEIDKNKFIRNEETLNNNKKFVSNPVLEKLEKNEERVYLSSKYKNLVWDIHDDLVVKIYQKILSNRLFHNYIKKNIFSFDEDKKLIENIFYSFIANNNSFYEHVATLELSWSHSLHISNSMVQKTIDFIKDNSLSHTLLKAMKNDNDKNFAKSLLKNSLENWNNAEKKIEKRLENWNLNRIALMDQIILIAAISELDYFPMIHSNIIINEYIEIAKSFATEKSQTFINGLLDRYVKSTNRN